jgi:hypothetical protein
MAATNLEVRTDWESLERSVGPVKGYCLALCAYASAEAGGWVGYYKVCARMPESYWDAPCLLKGATAACDSAHQALRAAEDEARLVVGNLPRAQALDAWREMRPLNFLERHVLRHGGWARA